MSLNPEPASPTERKEHHLPPKSYADAAEEGLGSNGYVDEDSIKETPPNHGRKSSQPRALGEILDESEEHFPQPASPSPLPRSSSRRGASTKSYADAAVDHLPKTNGKPLRLDFGADGEVESYSGEGMDESPRSPARKPHKRTSSKSLKGDKKEAKEVNEGPGGTQSKLVYEEFHNGEQLTSVKPSDGFEASHRQDENKVPEEQASSKEELVSGRRAGAGWEKSAYVEATPPPRLICLLTYYDSIRWAPLNVPLQRRLQTFMVLAHTLSIVSFLTLFFALCAVPILWPVLVPYLIYVLFSKAGVDGSLRHRSETLRRLPIWSLFASYFPARLHRSQILQPTRKYIFGYHPHGIISHGAFSAFGTEALGFSQLFPGITNTLLTLDSNFRIPLYRDYALRMGLASVSRESCENILSRGGHNGEGMGRAITIVVGGARESLDAQPGALRLVLARRKGFIKLAIRTGADLVPVLSFGENELYEQFDPTAHPRIHKFQLLVKKFMGFTVPLFHARGVFNYDVGMMPYRRPLNVVVGRPIMVQKMERPDQAYVDEVHKQYMDELKRIWDEWKDVFAKGRQGEMEIVE
ncbi:diacylglycerol O-acyltransferase 1 [Zalaria obscura]|uniref:Diacylglycerol O-acyltransferase 1 n=1 Tax=Zalaria obscura TaxID=2024903 RepID=A0ACC3SKQ1_9PEZI